MRLSTSLKAHADSPSDEALMERLQEGEDLALNLLMLRHKKKLYNFIRRYSGDDELAYDILQETFTRVYFSAATYRAEHSFSTWLYQIAVNLCRDHGRKRRRSLVTMALSQRFGEKNTDPFDRLAADEPTAEVVAASKQQLRLLDAAIQALPHELKIALILFTVEGESQNECARILGISPKAVETRVYRARRILANRLAR